jgi:hypothetical protein
MSLQITTAVLVGLILETLLYVKYWFLPQKYPCTYLGCNRSVLSVLWRITMALGQQPFKKAQKAVIAGQDGQPCGEFPALHHDYCGK